MVHFSISDIDEDETYVLEIGDRRLAQGSGNEAEEVSGQFTMPDLGGGERTVTVEAEIGERGDTTTVKRTLRYLGAVTPARAVAAPSPAPSARSRRRRHRLWTRPNPPRDDNSRPACITASLGPDTLEKGAAAGPKEKAHDRAAAGRRRLNTSAVKRAKKEEKAKPKRERARTAPLFDGVPESSGGSATPGRSTRSSGPNATALPPATLARAATDGAYSGPAAAVLAPALLGLAALALVCTALLRGRRRRPR